VRWQLLQKARRGAEGGSGGDASSGGGEPAAHPPPAAAGAAGAPGAAAAETTAAAEAERLLGASLRVRHGGADTDWAALEAGPALVHVFTARAREYYDVEGLWGRPNAVWAVRAPGAACAMTLDTIRA
jgi:hypothetical protein